MFKRIVKMLLTFCMAQQLVACVIHQAPVIDDPAYAPAFSLAPPEAQKTNGSLYSGEQVFELFSDTKARKPGDIIEVILSESTVSSKSANVEIKKDAEIANNRATLMGEITRAGGLDLSSSATSERDFSGEADASQRNNLRGSISVTVMEVWPNGTLVVRGEKWMRINTGDEFIRLSGLIRPQDVRNDNTIQSTKIANARITYSGTGALADSQSQGFLGRFFNSAYWPF